LPTSIYNFGRARAENRRVAWRRRGGSFSLGLRCALNLDLRQPIREIARAVASRTSYKGPPSLREILSLQRAGVSTTSAELLLERMLTKIDTLCAERDRVKAEQPGHNKGKVLGGRRW
jgi:hypothetical protein